MGTAATLKTPEQIERFLKASCTGCGCCAAKCPAECIRMTPDKEGFLYPKIDASKCMRCRLCVATCPAINTPAPVEPRAALALMAKDDALRKASSSGGVCALLARAAVERGGVVFGAAFNDKMELRHIAAEKAADLALLSGSKYIQSDTAGTFAQAQEYLRSGRYVAYFGTSCQIAGLKAYLGGEKFKGELLCVDLICHGVPSPEVFRKYIRETELLHGAPITDIRFRDKGNGWKKSSLQTIFADGAQTLRTHGEDLYMKGFLRNLYLRPCCHNCKFKNFRGGSDLLVGDFWNVRLFAPALDDNKGISLAVVLSDVGNKRLSEIGDLMSGREIPRGARSWSANIAGTPSPHPRRAQFFAALNSAPSVIELIQGTLLSKTPTYPNALAEVKPARADRHAIHAARIARRRQPRHGAKSASGPHDSKPGNRRLRTAAQKNISPRARRRK